MFALAGLAAAAPSVRVVPLDVIGPNMLRVSSNLNRGQENVISSIMMSLEPAIDAAIQRALAAGSFSSFSSFGTTGPVKFTGANGNTNFEGSYEGSSFSSSFEGNSASGGVAGAGQVSTQELGNQGITIEVVNSDANRWNAGISGASLQNSGAAFQAGSQQNSGAAFQAGSQQNSGAAFQAGSLQNSGASFQQTDLYQDLSSHLPGSLELFITTIVLSILELLCRLGQLVSTSRAQELPSRLDPIRLLSSPLEPLMSPTKRTPK